MHRLSRAARNGWSLGVRPLGAASPNLSIRGFRLFQVPRRQAGAVRVRTRSREGGRMRGLPYPARRSKSSHAEVQQHWLALLVMPHRSRLRTRAGHGSHDVYPTKRMLAVSRGNPRIEL